MSVKSLTRSLSFLKTEDPLKTYEKVETLGSGAQADVYKGVNKASGKDVAIKVIRLKDGVEAGTDHASIVEEVTTMRECRHENIVKYHDSFLTTDSFDKELWIIMEYCGAGSCQDLYMTASKPLDERVIAYVCREVLKGLKFVHERGRIHRDVKACNVLVTTDGAIKLGDFGVAGRLSSKASRASTHIGTPYWMAPEIVSANDGYDQRADVWSLGITAYELAKKGPPHSDKHPLRALRLIEKSSAPRLSGDEWSSEFKDFVKCCLVKDPAKRPSAAKLLKHDFLLGVDTHMSRRLLSKVIKKVKKQQRLPGMSLETFAKHVMLSPQPDLSKSKSRRPRVREVLSPGTPDAATDVSATPATPATPMTPLSPSPEASGLDRKRGKGRARPLFAPLSPTFTTADTGTASPSPSPMPRVVAGRKGRGRGGVMNKRVRQLLPSLVTASRTDISSPEVTNTAPTTLPSTTRASRGSWSSSSDKENRTSAASTVERTTASPSSSAEPGSYLQYRRQRQSTVTRVAPSSSTST